MSKERCQIQITGTCTGCGVYEIIKRAVNKKLEPIDTAVNRISSKYCPTDEQPLVNTKRTRGGMGQTWIKSKRVV